jgi:hypothetical protein
MTTWNYANWMNVIKKILNLIGVVNVKIFNIKQADIFIKNYAKVIGCGLGDKYKTYIEFEENEIFKKLMNRWMSKKF